MRVNQIICLLVLVPLFSVSQVPSIQWAKCIGGATQDDAYSIRQTSDGGYIVGGSFESNDGIFSSNHGYQDIGLFKLDSSGNIKWFKLYGGTADEFMNGDALRQTYDGGYVFAASTLSTDGDVNGAHCAGGACGFGWNAAEDFWVVKTDSIGTLIWQKCLGGFGEDWAYSISQTTDSGYIVGGRVRYSSITTGDGDITNYHGGFDWWIVKLNKSGDLQWQRCLGGVQDEEVFSVIQTNDGGYIAAGNTEPQNSYSDCSSTSKAWVVRFNSAGDIMWQKCYGGSLLSDVATAIIQTPDWGYAFAGAAVSNDGDVSGNHGGNDFWLVKLNNTGSIQWQKCLGGSGDEGSWSFQQTTDRGYVLTGTTASNDGDVSGNHGFFDYWVVKTDSSGNFEWGKCLGGSNTDYAQSVRQTQDGGYIVAGYSNSLDGDVNGNHGGSDDYWIVKLGPADVGIASQQTNIMDLAAFINNATGNLSLRFYSRATEQMNLRFVDITGRTIAMQKLFVTEGINRQQIKLPALAAGVYVVNVDGVAAKVVVE